MTSARSGDFGDSPMASARLEHLLAGTAIALALALTPYASSARAASDAEITAAVPMPESADLPPPSIRDIAPAEAAAPAPAATPAPTATDITHSMPASDGAKFTTASVGDTAIVEKLRDPLAAGKFDRILGGKKDRSTVETS